MLVAVPDAVFVGIAHVDLLLHRKEEPVSGLCQFLVVQGYGTCRLALLEGGPDLVDGVHFVLGRLFLVSAELAEGFDGFFKALVHGVQVGQGQFGCYHIDVVDRVNAVGHVDDVRVVETAHNMRDDAGLPDVRQEFVAQALAFGRAGDEARNVDKFDDGRNPALGLEQFDEPVKPGIGNGDNAGIWLYGAKRVVGRLGLGAGEGRKYGGLADIGQSDDTAIQSHGVPRGRRDGAIESTRKGGPGAIRLDTVTIHKYNQPDSSSSRQTCFNNRNVILIFTIYRIRNSIYYG